MQVTCVCFDDRTRLRRTFAYGRLAQGLSHPFGFFQLNAPVPSGVEYCTQKVKDSGSLNNDEERLIKNIRPTFEYFQEAADHVQMKPPDET